MKRTPKTQQQTKNALAFERGKVSGLRGEPRKKIYAQAEKMFKYTGIRAALFYDGVYA